MKKYLTILFFFLSLVNFAQSDSSFVSTIKQLPIHEMRLMTPDSNFTTVNNDSIIIGEIVEICKSQYNIAGQTVGVIKLLTNNSNVNFQVLFFDNLLITDLEIGANVNFEIQPYSPNNEDLNKTMGVCCVAINGYNLGILKKVNIKGY